MSGSRQLVLGTHNRKKGRELADLLAPYDFEVQTLEQFADALEVPEEGQQFAENAAAKAVEQARFLQRWVIGEDSGLCVDALDGAPGIYSARFSGPQATDASNNALLLERLQGVQLADRTACYVCHICLADPGGNVRLRCEATCRGRVALAAAGTAGFGYDPLFEIVEYHQTFGQLGDAVKRVISHRARAVRMFTAQLLRFVRAGHWPTATTESA